MSVDSLVIFSLLVYSSDMCHINKNLKSMTLLPALYRLVSHHKQMTNRANMFSVKTKNNE